MGIPRKGMSGAMDGATSDQRSGPRFRQVAPVEVARGGSLSGLPPRAGTIHSRFTDASHSFAFGSMKLLSARRQRKTIG